MTRTCTEDECDQPRRARGLCQRHYVAQWKAAAAPAAGNACPSDHRHGAAATCYDFHKCRCADCHSAHTAARRNRTRLIAYGRWDTGLVDAEPVREHVQLLGEFGIGYRQVGKVAGVSYSTMGHLLYNQPATLRITKATAEKLLAVTPDISHIASTKGVPARGARRRLQALCRIGWSQARLSRELGGKRLIVNEIVGGRKQTIAKSTHVKVAELYERLWATEPAHDDHRSLITFNRARNAAAARRWVPPLGWDDIDTDVTPPVPDADDAGAVDEVAVQLACSGESVRLSPAERREAVTRLVDAKLSDNQIADRLGCTDRTVLRIRIELGLAAPIGYDGQVRTA